MLTKIAEISDFIYFIGLILWPLFVGVGLAVFLAYQDVPLFFVLLSLILGLVILFPWLYYITGTPEI